MPKPPDTLKQVVLAVHPHMAFPSGSSRFIIEALDRLNPNDFDVYVVLQYMLPRFRQLSRNLHYVELGGPLPSHPSYWISWPRLVARLSTVCKKLDPAVVFPHVFPSNLSGILTGVLREKPIVWYCQEPSMPLHEKVDLQRLPNRMEIPTAVVRGAVGMLDRSLARMTDLILTNSEYSRRRIREVYGLEATVVHLGVDPIKFRPGGKKGGFVLCVARLRPFKRLDWLLLAFQAFLRRNPSDVRLLIVGEGEYQDYLSSRVKVLGIETKVAFLGYVDEEELIRLYQEALCLVVPTLGEPFGLGPVEAMACGTPVVGVRSGGLLETVVDGRTGYLVDPTDVNGFADALTQIVEQGSDYQEMCRLSRMRAVEEFTWEKTAAGISNSLLKVIESRQ